MMGSVCEDHRLCSNTFFSGATAASWRRGWMKKTLATALALGFSSSFCFFLSFPVYFIYKL